MLSSLWFSVLVGAVLGLLAGLGIGGGSLLILWLTAILHYNPYTARSINLLFFLPAAAISSLFRLRHKRIRIGQVLPAVFAGCLCAWAAIKISAGIDLHVLKKLYGILLLFTGFRELTHQSKKES